LEVVAGELFDEVTATHFMDSQLEWRPVVLEAARALLQSGASPSMIPTHWHWDWVAKTSELRALSFSFWGIECEGHLQGLMKLDIDRRSSRLPAQKRKPVVYVDYLETAPWNVKVLMKALGRKTRFGSVGTRLMEAAIRKSLEEGYKGRVALHSLPGAERFYLDVCGMTAFERDPDKHNLLWCEFTPEQAESFIREVNA
jgi:hypothetical protein